MDQDARVRQREALALLAGHQQEGAHRCRLPDAERDYIVLDVLHRVVDGEACGDRSAWRVDVELNVLLRVLAREEEELRDDEVRDVVVDRCSKEDDVVAQQTAVDVVGAFAPARLLEHHRNKSHSSSSLFLGIAGSEYSHALRMWGMVAGWATHLRVSADCEGGMCCQN